MSILSPLTGRRHLDLSRRRHLDDDAIAALWSARIAADGAGPGSASADGSWPWKREDDHVRSCSQCRARYDAFASWLADARAEAIDEADEVFPAERLAAQQAQILRRLESLERPARVLAFPKFRQPVTAGRRGPQRWIAAAAVAGLVVGLGAGELFNLRRATSGGHLGSQALAAVGQSARGGRQPVGLNLNVDDAVLYDDADAASISPSVEALQALDALTPRVRDLDQAR